MTPKIDPFQIWWKQNYMFHPKFSRSAAKAAWEAALSHIPSALNRNDTIEYWMTRATTAELKLQEFAKLLDESKASEAAAQPTQMQHGINCNKVSHTSGVGYLHGPRDDSPYDVDGVIYCGRCHAAL